MRSTTPGEISAALGSIGIRQGDIVNVHSRLHAIGTVGGTRDTREIPAAYLAAIRDVIGPQGTVVVPTYTTAFARYGRPFVLEETPSESGVLSEHVRTRPGARRVLHPVVSLTALGARASELADDHPRWNVGGDTIWDRMLRAGGKVVTIGIEPKRSMSFMHQVEFLACVPYLYHKVIRGEVRAGGVLVPHDFLMAVRYLDYGIEYDLSRLDAALEGAGAMRRAPIGGSFIWAVAMRDAFDVGVSGLRSDPYFLLRRPPAFAEGRIPTDGTTIGREGSSPRYFLA